MVARVAGASVRRGHHTATILMSAVDFPLIVINRPAADRAAPAADSASRSERASGFRVGLRWQRAAFCPPIRRADGPPAFAELQAPATSRKRAICTSVVTTFGEIRPPSIPCVRNARNTRPSLDSPAASTSALRRPVNSIR